GALGGSLERFGARCSLLAGHLLHVVLESLEVLRRLFGITVRVGLLLAGRGLWVRQPGELLLHSADLREDVLTIVARLAQLPRQPAQLLKQCLAARIL